jgi:hypothetical protein
MALRAEGANRNCPTFPPGDGRHRVNLAEHPGSQHRIRHFISLQTGELESSYEIRKLREVSLVESLLGKQRGGGEITLAQDYPSARITMHFDVPAWIEAAGVAAKLAQILRGQVRGLYRHVLHQNGFHGAHGAFEALRKAAGNTPITLRKHEHRSASGGLFESARANQSVWVTTAKTLEALESGRPVDRRDEAQVKGARVVYGPEAAYICPVCGDEMIDTPIGKSCKQAARDREELCPMCGDALEVDPRGAKSCKRAASAVA